MDIYNASVATVLVTGHTTTSTKPVTQLVVEDGLKVAMGAVLVISMLMSLCGNSIVCVIVYRKPAMRSAINLLLANMALCNILLSATCTPFALCTLVTTTWVLGDVLCRIVAFLHRLFVCEAVLILFTISVDRYLIIVKRLDKLSPFIAKVLITVTWCVSVSLSLPPVFGWGLYQYYLGWMQCVLGEWRTGADMAYLIISIIVTFYVPMAVLTYTYLCIAHTVRKRANRVHHVQTDTLGPHAARLSISILPYPPHIVGVDISFKTRTFKTILMLFVVFAVCWLPYSVITLHWNLSRTLSSNYVAGNLLLCLGYLNTAINPCIYCWRIDKFREACHDLFPASCRSFPLLPKRTRRRVDPSALYRVKDRSTSA